MASPQLPGLTAHLPTRPAPSDKARGRSDLSAKLLFILFALATLVAPAAWLNKAPFVVIFASLLRDAAYFPAADRFKSWAPAFIAGLFAYGFGLALTTSSDPGLALQFLTSVFVLFMIFYIDRHDIDLDHVAVIASLTLVACTALFWGAIVMPDMPYAATIYHFFLDYNFSAATDRDFFAGGATFTLQLGTAPFLFVGFCVVGLRLRQRHRRKVNAALLLLIYAAILISGLRGLIAITTLYGVYLVLRFTPSPWRWFLVLGTLFGAWIVAQVLLSSSQVLSVQESSNSVKLGHLQSYFDDASVLSMLFGRGLANFYFSSGSQSMKAYTELTPVDMARYLGVVGATLLYGLLLFPRSGLRQYAARADHVVAFALYLLLSFTNPVLFNSYGMLVVLWYWSHLIPPRAAAARP